MVTEGPRILGTLWRLLGAESDVMDAYQECFCRLAAHPEPMRIKNAKAYVYRTASNIAIEMLRVRTRRRSHLPGIAQVQAARGRGTTTVSSSVAALQEAIAELPPHLRNVIILRDLSRLSYREVGQTLNIDAATARVYRRHAVVKLSNMLTMSTIS